MELERPAPKGILACCLTGKDRKGGSTTLTSILIQVGFVVGKVFGGIFDAANPLLGDLQGRTGFFGRSNDRGILQISCSGIGQSRGLLAFGAGGAIAGRQRLALQLGRPCVPVTLLSV